MADCGCGAGLSASLWQGWKMGALGGAISGAGTGSALGGSFGSSGGPVGILVGGYVGSVIGSALGAAFGSVMGAAESWGGHILFSQCGCSPLCLCLPRDWRAPQATPTRRDPLVLDLNRDGKVELKNAAFFDLNANGFHEFTGKFYMAGRKHGHDGRGVAVPHSYVLHPGRNP